MGTVLIPCDDGRIKMEPNELSIEVAKEDQIIDLQELARDCYKGTDIVLAYRQGEKDGVKYCKWLFAETVIGNKERGDVICSHADISVLLEDQNGRHPKCNYIKLEE